jgi:hypothetical protein
MTLFGTAMQPVPCAATTPVLYHCPRLTRRQLMECSVEPRSYAHITLILCHISTFMAPMKLHAHKIRIAAAAYSRPEMKENRSIESFKLGGVQEEGL